MGALRPTYWQALIVVCVIYFTRFDWSFVVLRAKQVCAGQACSAADPSEASCSLADHAAPVGHSNIFR